MYDTKSKQHKDDLNSSSLQQLLFKTIFTYFNALNGNMNSVEANSPWRPVCTVSPIIIDTNQHIFTGPEKKTKQKTGGYLSKNLLLIMQLGSFGISSNICQYCHAAWQCQSRHSMLPNLQTSECHFFFTLKPQYFRFPSLS